MCSPGIYSFSSCILVGVHMVGVENTQLYFGPILVIIPMTIWKPIWGSSLHDHLRMFLWRMAATVLPINKALAIIESASVMQSVFYVIVKKRPYSIYSKIARCTKLFPLRVNGVLGWRLLGVVLFRKCFNFCFEQCVWWESSGLGCYSGKFIVFHLTLK